MARARKPTDRSTSARIAQRLKNALLAPQPLSYAELARAAGCDQRTVRNYLASAPTTLGFEIKRIRGADRAIRVKRLDDGLEVLPTVEEIARALAYDMLRRVFPIAGTELERLPSKAIPQMIVLARGAYEYKEHHFRALRTWLLAASRRFPVRFCYDAVSSGRGERTVWPVGVVLRGLTRVYLAGVPAEARDAKEQRTYALEWIEYPEQGAAILPLQPDEVGSRPEGLEHVTINDAINQPFGMFRCSGTDGVTVHVRFAPKVARYVEGRAWHRKQKIKKLPDGSIEIHFKPAHLNDATEWVREWGAQAQVLGDETLLAELEKDLESALRQIKARRAALSGRHLPV